MIQNDSCRMGSQKDALKIVRLFCKFQKALRVASAYDGQGLSKLIIKWIFTYLTRTESDFRVLRADYTTLISACYQYASELLRHD